MLIQRLISIISLMCAMQPMEINIWNNIKFVQVSSIFQKNDLEQLRGCMGQS